MSKLTKLIKTPKLFFQDAITNRQMKKQFNSKPVPAKKPAPTKKPAPAKKPVKNIDVSHVNFYEPIPFMIHSGELLKAGESHLRMWIPIFIQSKLNFLIVVRNEDFYNWLKKEYPWLSIALARRAVDIEELVNLLPDTKHVFYPSSTGNNIHITRFNHLNQIFIGHGDSNKAASAHKALRLYDEIWTAGDAHIDRFRNSNFDTAHLHFLKVGRPNLASILQKSTVVWDQRGQTRILYLPTWEGVTEEANYSSTHLSGQILREVQRKTNQPISVKYHPLTGNRNNSLKDVNKLTRSMIEKENIDVSIVDTSVDISKVIPLNTVFICDISAVVSECLSANGPIFVYIPTDRAIVTTESNMHYEDYCYTYSSIEELLDKMEKVLSGNDYLAEKRLEAIDYFIGKEETLNNYFIEQLKSMAAKKDLKYTSRLFNEFI